MAQSLRSQTELTGAGRLRALLVPGSCEDEITRQCSLGTRGRESLVNAGAMRMTAT